MTDIEDTNNSNANILCKACGLCCTGYLFIWAKLRPSELDSAEALGLQVFRSDPSHRRFSQPCPLWQGQCTIYATPHYPHVCRAYKCKLLKELLNDETSLPNALTVIGQIKEKISELELLLPISSSKNFRERVVAQIEALQQSARQEQADIEFSLKAKALLTIYDKVFEVRDFLDPSDN
ncbi:MAG: YkgJ family cysteine cluster protein [Chloroflexota bacterium]